MVILNDDVMDEDKRALAISKANQLCDAMVLAMYHINQVNEKYQIMKKVMGNLPFEDFKVLDSNVGALLHRVKLVENIGKDMDLWLTIFELKEGKEKYE